MHLALKQDRVDHRAEVVDHGVARNCHHAAVGIDLYLDDVAAVRERVRGRRLHVGRVEPRLHSGRQLGRIARRRGNVEEVDAAIGADDAEFAIAVFDVGGGGLEQVCRDGAALLDDLERCLVQRRARDGERARAAGKTAGRAVAVTVDDLNLVRIDTEPVGHKLLV